MNHVEALAAVAPNYPPRPMRSFEAEVNRVLESRNEKRERAAMVMVDQLVMKILHGIRDGKYRRASIRQGDRYVKAVVLTYTEWEILRFHLDHAGEIRIDDTLVIYADY